MDLASSPSDLSLTLADGAVSSCSARAMPPQVPAGWEEYDDWSCKCRFYVPRTQLPAPVQWEACGTSAPAGIACRWMSINWTTSDPLPIGSNPRAWIDGSGTAFLRFTRFDRMSATPSEQYVVAEADGPAHGGIMATLGPSAGCGIFDFSDMREHHVAWYVAGDDEAGDLQTTQHHGAIGGDIDTRHPPVLVHHVDSADYAFSVSNSWSGEFSTAGAVMTLSAWDGSKAPVQIASQTTDPEMLSPIGLWLNQSDAFWSLNSLARPAVMAWDSTRNAHALLRWNGDRTQGAWDLGTDGSQMVWEYGSGRSATGADTDPFPTRNVMTAAYTTDPAALQPKRLRSDPNAGYRRPYVVGCGYAARATDVDDLFVVRLADGWSWTVKASATAPRWVFDQALGVTCSEVFATVDTMTLTQIVRISLASLGPGSPPD